MATFTALMLTPYEQEKLIIYQVADLARKRRARGVKLNLPESIALISEAILEAARDGKALDEATTNSSVKEGRVSWYWSLAGGWGDPGVCR